MQLSSANLCFSFVSSQVDKLEEADSQRKTEEEVTEPQTMVFGQQLMLTAPAAAPVAPQQAYPGYGYPAAGYSAPPNATAANPANAAAAAAGYPAQPAAYGYSM